MFLQRLERFFGIRILDSLNNRDMLLMRTMHMFVITAKIIADRRHLAQK